MSLSKGVSRFGTPRKGIKSFWNRLVFHRDGAVSITRTDGGDILVTYPTQAEAVRSLGHAADRSALDLSRATSLYVRLRIAQEAIGKFKGRTPAEEWEPYVALFDEAANYVGGPVRKGAKRKMKRQFVDWLSKPARDKIMTVPELARKRNPSAVLASLLGPLGELQAMVTARGMPARLRDKEAVARARMGGVRESVDIVESKLGDYLAGLQANPTEAEALLLRDKLMFEIINPHFREIPSPKTEKTQDRVDVLRDVRRSLLLSKNMLDRGRHSDAALHALDALSLYKKYRASVLATKTKK
ncbi:Uncharacterised protein [Candidatus Norongarragalina meridionalis]|nr:Uncharacterised protein [Candidatus Norongarragalina meridionalis]